MEGPIHTYKTFVSFGETDASGRIYYGSMYAVVHRAVEDFAMKKNIYSEWFANKEWATPVRHSEADYLAELNAGSEVDVHLYMDRIGETSFTWRFEVMHKGTLAAKVKVTHVTVDLKTGKKRPNPESLRQHLQL